MKIVQTAAGAALILTLHAVPAFAAPPAPTAPASTAAPAPRPVGAPPAGGPSNGFGGPVIPGVCMVSREQIFAQSLVGQAASGRLKQLGQKAQSNLEAQRRKLEADAKALQAKEAVTPPADVQRRQQQLQGRAQGLQVEAGQAQRELEATRAKVMGLIEEAVQPVILSVYQSKGCGLLLSRDAVLGGNMANDLTAAVVQGLDAKMTTLTFEREHLPPAATPTR